MTTLRRRLRALIGFAFLAALGLLVAPVSAQAMRAAADAPWNEICTTAADGSTERGSPVSTHVHEQCPVCSAGQVGAPPPGAFGDIDGVLPSLQPQRLLRAPARTHAWASAQPRGPPTAG